MSIRTRLLLLVFVVWLPAAAAIGLLAESTYMRESSAARDRIRQVAQRLNFAIEREIERRAVLARTLAASQAVHDLDLRRFHQEASLAAARENSFAFVVDRHEQLVNTRVPLGELRRLPRPADAALVTEGTDVRYTPVGPLIQRPVIAVLVPEGRNAPPRVNMGVSFEPSALQEVLESEALPEGSVASVIDASQRVMARSRNPARWLGQAATGDLRRRAQAREEGYAESVTLDGVPSLTYLSAPNRYDWAVVIALPQVALARAAQRVTAQALAASCALLMIGLALAAWGSRRISTPLIGLRDAALELGHDRVPARLMTGVAEADEVSAALHEAGVRSQEATRLLEERVAEAVQQARDAQARLFDAQKHEAIGRLTGGIAHDFNNLLQTISTAHHVLDRTLGAEGPQRRVLQGAMRATAKAADLIRQMLTFGRAQPLQPQPVDLRDLVLKSQELTSKAVGERVALSAHLQPGLPAIFVDPVQLELALLNLVFNARDAMPQGGHVAISGRMASDEEAASVGGGRFVCVEVIDDGDGMDAETAAKAFEPYFTTKAPGAGTGLGLPQAQAFARQSGGDIRLSSARGQGTRVGMLLPACDAAVEPQEPAAAAPPPTRPLRLLMVEDDVLVSSVLVPVLEAEGHAVTLCGTADDAVRQLQDHPDGFDLLFTDVVMPGRLTGLDLLAWCREHRPQLPAVLATGYTAQAVPDARVRVLRKPYGIDALLRAIGESVDGDGDADTGERAAAATSGHAG